MSDGAHVIPKVEGSKWEVEISDDNGPRTMRLTECPRGYALERTQNNPQADHCVECPGSSDAAYSLREARWSGNESLTGVSMWCEPCPKPAGSVDCAGDNLVTGKEGWWLVEEQEEPVEGQQSRRDGLAIKHVFRSTELSSPVLILSLPFVLPGRPLVLLSLSRSGVAYVGRTYKCDPGVCMANNSCANGRSGVACGSCPDNHVLTVGICTKCPDQSPERLFMWRAIFCIVGGSIVAAAWFILCWAPVFGATAQEIFMKWFGWYESMPYSFIHSYHMAHEWYEIWCMNGTKCTRRYAPCDAHAHEICTRTSLKRFVDWCWCLCRPIRMFNRSKALFGKAKALAQKSKRAQAFFSNPKNLKLFQQVSASHPRD